MTAQSSPPIQHTPIPTDTDSSILGPSITGLKETGLSHTSPNKSLPHRRWLLSQVTALALLGGVAAGCGAAPVSEAGADQAIAPTAETSVAPAEPDNGLLAANGDGQTTAVNAPGTPPAEATETDGRSLPQLIKRAQLDLTVDSVDDAIAQITTLTQQHGGDVLGLENYTPANNTIRHRASMELRVPQEKLDDTVIQLTELGTATRQVLTAEDVAGQLVDFEARLKNLRKAEEVTLGIMERSGDIGDVLQVGQELQTIRASIEQIAGQLSYLRNQVRFSTITLSIEGAIAPAPKTSTILTQLGNTWSAATRSVSAFTLALVQLGIWLLVYIPYWLVIGGLAFIAYRRMRHRQSSSSTPKS